MFTYRSLNALGCLRSASASVWPLSTSYTTARVTSASTLFSVCCDRMSSACTSGRPELIMVANCRVKMTTSRVFTPGLKKSAIPPPFPFASRTCTTIMRFLRRCAMTSSRDPRSILSRTRSPFMLRAAYSKFGILYSSASRLTGAWQPLVGPLSASRPRPVDRPSRPGAFHRWTAGNRWAWM